jgi:hypothetical protein
MSYSVFPAAVGLLPHMHEVAVVDGRDCRFGEGRRLLLLRSLEQSLEAGLVAQRIPDRIETESGDGKLRRPFE